MKSRRVLVTTTFYQADQTLEETGDNEHTWYQKFCQGMPYKTMLDLDITIYDVDQCRVVPSPVHSDPHFTPEPGILVHFSVMSGPYRYNLPPRPYQLVLVMKLETAVN